MAESEWHKMLFAWMDTHEHCASCQQLHPGHTCFRQIFRKYEHVAKNNWAFYLTLHLIPFVLFKARKLRDKTAKERLQTFLQMAKNYAGSLLFMGTFVAILKANCCAYSRLDSYSFTKMVFAGSVFSSAALFFEERSRRTEIALFVCVRAFKAYYEFLKRRKIISIPHVDKLCFVLIFALLSYLYYQKPEFLKHKYILDQTLGKH